MTANNDHHAMHLLLERLVCDELEDADRRRILDWLEGDSGRWRLCGLAFLESQVWSRGLRELPEPSVTAAPRTIEKAALRCPTRYAQAAAIALSLLVAFVLGLSAERMFLPGIALPPPVGKGLPVHEAGKSNSSTAKPVMASIDVQPGLSAAMARLQVPVVPKTLPDEGSAPQVPEHIRRQWARRGYDVSVERRYVLAHLPDGERVMVPVEQLSLSRLPYRYN
jgi:hypothetical protein